jgi:hypothetical protein
LAVRRTSPICAVAALLFFAGPADAAELCVKCTGPDANYACIVKGATNASTADAAIKLYCITALAKAGPHASCAIDRDNKPPCQGERRELPVPDAIEHVLDVRSESQSATPPSAPITAGSATAPQSTDQQLPSNAAAQQQPAQPENAPPKTVQEMVEKGAQSAGAGISETGKSASEAAESTGTALQKAGSAVAKAAKNSWECLSSFFSKC